MILPAYKAALGGQLKKRPGPARASASLSPGFHPGSSHTRDVPITQYEIANHKSEIPFPPTPTRRPASSVFSPVLRAGVQARGMLKFHLPFPFFSSILCLQYEIRFTLHEIRNTNLIGGNFRFFRFFTWNENLINHYMVHLKKSTIWYYP